jgi:transcriptional regulator with XRE-family HTH domain
MFQIGASLREARTRRGLSSADVQKAIRIRERYLTALEEEKWDLLPGEAYAKGFLRTYAEFLGLDGDLYLDEWNSRFAHQDEPAPPPEPAARGRHLGVLRPVLAGLMIAVAIAAAAAWTLGSDGKAVHTRTPATGTTAAAPPVRKPPASTPPTAPVYAVFRAVRGRCWLLVRRSNAAGAVLYERTLAQGGAIRLPVGHALWVRAGAPWNLDVTVAGHPLTGLPTAPANVLVSKSGIAAA